MTKHVRHKLPLDEPLSSVADPGFPMGGMHPLGGAWTSDVGTFW